MNKFILIVILVFSLFSCSNQKNDMVYSTTDKLIDSTWEVLKITEQTNKIILTLEYEIVNKTDNTLWFYDIEKGNSWQTSAIHVLDRLYIQRYEIVDMYDGEWVSAGPYSMNPPLCREILPKDSLKGELNITYLKREGVSIYSTNFYILNSDITRIHSKVELRKLLNNNMHEHWIYFDLLSSTEYVTDVINIANLVMLSEYVISYYKFDNIDFFKYDNFELHITGNTGLENYEHTPYSFTDRADIQKFYDELTATYGFITNRERTKVVYIPHADKIYKNGRYIFFEEVEFFYGNTIASHTFYIVKEGDEHRLERVVIQFIHDDTT